MQSSEATRGDAFGYVCNRCSRCCRDKHIPVDPYEIARLARAKGQSVGEFRMTFTVRGQGTALRQKQDGACVFLGPRGCEVHGDRPLVCRIYPLGRHIRAGSEYFSTLEGHPLSEGDFTGRGTVAGYLEEQGAGPYIRAADGYLEWLCAAYRQFGLGPRGSAALAELGSAGSDLLDMDGMIAKHCAATGEVEPENIDDRADLHLKLLYNLIGNMGANDAQEAADHED
jgi:Fe-S-cluster containining protein